jgi:hypothetical protein
MPLTLQDVLTAGALLVALLALPSAWISSRAAKRSNGAEVFLAHSRSLREEQSSLAACVFERSPQDWRDGGIPMLARPEWIPSAPFDLEDLVIAWKEADDGQEVEKARRAAARVLSPLQIAPISRYSDALVQIAGISALFDGTVYRLLDVDLASDAKRMLFTSSSYFPYLDTCEVLAFEAELRRSAGKRIDGRGTLRRELVDPFELRNRVTILGINALTVRVENDRARFFLHRRNPKQVVNNSGLLGLIPAGEFAPSDVSSEARLNDFNIWRNIMREYAEELLGADDAQGQGGRWIDYANTFPYRELEQARARGNLRIKILGLGIDPLTWKPELLTICLIEAKEFDSIFTPVPNRNDEGTILTGNGDGLPFNVRTVAQYCTESAISPNAKAALQLAWQFRTELGLNRGHSGI